MSRLHHNIDSAAREAARKARHRAALSILWCNIETSETSGCTGVPRHGRNPLNDKDCYVGKGEAGHYKQNEITLKLLTLYISS